MKGTELKQGGFTQRLCGEIQLFDLCDLPSCHYKSGRFCSNHKLLESFEKIADEGQRSPVLYVYEESDDDEEIYADGFYTYDACEAEEDSDREDD